jgi:hypothetical protein
MPVKDMFQRYRKASLRFASIQCNKNHGGAGK